VLERRWAWWGREIAEDELRAVEIEAEHFRVLEDVRAVGEGGVEDAAFAIVADPGEGVVVVGAQALVIVVRLVGGEIGLSVSIRNRTRTFFRE
jgi:hypothetical protein